MAKRRQITRKGRPRAARQVTLKGDHGASLPAVTQGTVIVPIRNDPNGRGYRRRISALDRLIADGRFTMPEQQAAIAIRDAFARTEALSSGGPLKEQVQSSPKPDAAIAAQVDVMSLWANVTKAIRSDRVIVEHVCCYGLPVRTLPAKYKRRAIARLRAQLIRVAIHLGYASRQDIEQRVA